MKLAIGFDGVTSDRRQLLIVSLLYFAAYCMILFNNGLFWDDWKLVNLSDAEMREYFRGLGHPEVYYIHHLLLSVIGSTYLYKLLVFLSFWGCTVLLHRILSQVEEIDDYSRFFLVALFALFPVNDTRIALINTPAAIKNFFFFLGCYLLVASLRGGRLPHRIGALVCFLFSFTLNSVLFFYLAVVLVLLLYFGRKRYHGVRELVLKNAELFALPFAFWIGKSLFLAPYGASASYNLLNSEGLARGVLILLVPFYTSLVEVLMTAFNNYNGIYLLSTLVLAALVQREPEQGIDLGFARKAARVGLVLFTASVFPYLSVKKIPSNFDWDGRFQILIPLGAAVIVYYSLVLVMRKINLERSLTHLVLCFVLISFAGMSLTCYIRYKRDWYKQLSIMENLKQYRGVVAGKELAFQDRTPELNANSRSYRLYEYQGLINGALGRGSSTARRQGSAGATTVSIDHGDYPLNSRNILCLMVREVVTHDLFEMNIRRATNLTLL